MISTRTLDYAVGSIMIAAPWLFGFAANGPETWIFVALGLAALIYSLLTDYELGFIRALPLRAHLSLDLLNGLLLAASPFLFGFADSVVMPHWTFGLLEIVVVALTWTTIARVPA